MRVVPTALISLLVKQPLTLAEATKHQTTDGKSHEADGRAAMAYMRVGNHCPDEFTGQAWSKQPNTIWLGAEREADGRAAVAYMRVRNRCLDQVIGQATTQSGQSNQTPNEQQMAQQQWRT